MDCQVKHLLFPDAVSFLKNNGLLSYYNSGLSEAYDINLHIEENVEKLKLDGDVALLTRAYENIIGNSIRHNESCQIEIVLSQQERELLIHFTDNGTGIPDMVIEGLSEEKEHISEYQENIHIMGLRVVKKIIQAHHGKMDIEKLSEGASVKIYLPL